MYSLRNATINDMAAMMEIGHEGLRPHIEALRGWDAGREEQGFRDHFVPEYIEIIQVAGTDAGYIKLEHYEDHVYVDGIYIGKQFRSKGLGTQVLTDKLRKHAHEKLPFRLRVLHTNPAQGLYARLGFTVIGETADATLMQFGR